MAVYLKSLDLQGFKSFGSKTHIEFSDGITGIVGPNGCGKSNVIEAMKWALGEQSAKSLRGEKMQDIIFAGTKHRSASGMAEVSLTLNNELNWLPLDYHEVSIGRRVFRSGEGQYFVNGTRSRLKDTVELFWTLELGVIHTQSSSKARLIGYCLNQQKKGGAYSKILLVFQSSNSVRKKQKKNFNRHAKT